MSTILSRIAVVGIVAGGFALTGDLGQLAKRGFEVVNARDIPSADRQDPASTESAAETTPPSSSATVAEAMSPEPSAPPARATIATTRDCDFRPTRDGIESLSVAEAAAGDRIVVWLATPRRSGGRAYRCLVLDVVDPAGGDVLVYEAASLASDGTPQTTASPPRRAVVKGTGPDGCLAKGGLLAMQRRGVTDDGVGHDTIGPVAALDLIAQGDPRQ